MLVANYTSITGGDPFNTGGVESFHELSTGNFVLDDDAFLPIIDAYSPIKEFRFFCVKPSVGRRISAATNENDVWGRHIRDWILHKTPAAGCLPDRKLSALRTFADDDNGHLINNLNCIGWNGARTQRLYNHQFFTEHRFPPKTQVTMHDKFHCDDTHTYNPREAGTWRFYVR